MQSGSSDCQDKQTKNINGNEMKKKKERKYYTCKKSCTHNITYTHRNHEKLLICSKKNKTIKTWMKRSI